MTAEKRNFETTQGLLEDVMRKQAGSIEKAVLEAVMNSVDAGATEVDIALEEDKLLIDDDGDGMSRSEVREYFQKFGLKGDDIEDKEFGKFRMGRGQIFSFGQNIWYTNDMYLVVDLDNDSAEVNLENKDYELDTSGLSYHVIDAEDIRDGCSITVNLYETIDDVEDKVNDIKKLIKYIPWLHDVDLTINGESYSPEFEYTYETDTAYVAFKDGSYWNDTLIYNKGAKVKQERLVATRAIVVTKEDLDLNFARNDILSGCPVYERVREELVEVYKTYLKNKDDLSKDETNWIVKEMEDDSGLMAAFYQKPMIKTATGEQLSMEEIGDGPVVLNKGSASMAKDIQRRTGAIPIDEDHKDLFSQEGIFKKKKDYSEVVDKEMKFEMDPYNEEKISKTRRENLYRLQWAIKRVNRLVDVKVGVSKHRDMWMTDKNTLYVDKNFLKAKKTEFATHVLPAVLKHSQFKCDTRTEVNKSGTFNRRVAGMLDELGDVQQKILEGHPDVEGYVEGQMV